MQKKHFDLAVHYDKHCFAQQEIAHHFINQKFWPTSKSVSNILEIGCGSGNFSKLLIHKYSHSSLICSDKSENMICISKEKLANLKNISHFLSLDADISDFNEFTHGFDLISSNLAFQWFQNVPKTCSKLWSKLNNGGQLLFSTLAKNSFQEWNDLCESLNWPSGFHSYPESQNLKESLCLFFNESYIDIQEHCIKIDYSNPWHFLISIKGVGAGNPQEHYLPMPTHLIRSIKLMKDPFSVRWNVLYVSIIKP